MRAEGATPGQQGPADQRFPKALRLLSRREFLEVQDGGQKLPSDCLLALYKRNGRTYSRVGLTVSSKVGNAVVRARLRRVLRELFRKRRMQWPPGLDVVLVARSSAKEASFVALSRAFDGVTRKLQRLPPAAEPKPKEPPR
ncbi:ribonuclease P protein component [Myxococcus sp. CA051A]|uniref:Ribonuclease P protein component n=1 Tax=Myxococcus llanfairpwllgwyngyllgogerychwyrndrobwllllantysiliogogogochensis TaxID=2590453 RepID=A0A540WJL5_9BACT|nr:ribonuclease P protein component [Myxococcus llanfairpwllgwyngyllgogerychwyrndrobwllllantysiliogogogochensis]NTX05950.1 ribonuclease P protein component [Myxococcus sp. CA040A]NTX10564.1 ribonuclease P protein component [Myxococcus sp. CA056]NTX38199.1 ribonuclease P protein component [Myxococcus sp. CA033]NTX55730.1 ribonuclease P protein component [Myxococcus sp. CA039A]NTX63348.1 ribonuclease P protein component [Myxococcus sp. CA051A]